MSASRNISRVDGFVKGYLVYQAIVLRTRLWETQPRPRAYSDQDEDERGDGQLGRGDDTVKGVFLSDSKHEQNQQHHGADEEQPPAVELERPAPVLKGW